MAQATLTVQDRRPDSTVQAIDQLWIKRQEFERRINDLEALVDSEKSTQQILDAIPKKARVSFDFIWPIEFENKNNTLRVNRRYFDKRYLVKDGSEGTQTVLDNVNFSTGTLFGFGTATPLQNAGTAAGDFSGSGIHVYGSGAGRVVIDGGPPALNMVDHTGGVNDKMAEAFVMSGVLTFRSLNDDASQRIGNILVLDLGDGGVKMSNLKSGATQVGAGAAAGEIYSTSSHASLPDDVLMVGV